MKYEKVTYSFCLFQNKSCILLMMTLFMTSLCKNLLENNVKTTDMKSAGIHFLNYQSFRPTQPFSFLDKSTGPNLLFVALALYWN